MSLTSPMSERSALDVLRSDQLSRKRFLRRAGGGGAAGLAVLLSACGSDKPVAAPAQADPQHADDLAIVNYALSLEYLEADFYRQVVEGNLLRDKKLGELAKRIADSEQAHVEALTATAKELGGEPASKPITHFGDILAGGPNVILKTAAFVENLGAAAYLGQVGAIKSPDVLAEALAIHTVEARHAAALNELVGNAFKGDAPLAGSLPDGAFAKPMTMSEVLGLVRPFYS